MNRTNYLIKNTALFLLNSVGTKLISFFLVPLYTYALSTSEYGLVDLVTTLATVVVPIITLNINESVMRFALDDDADVGGILSVGLLFGLSSFISGLLIIPLTRLMPSLYEFRYYIYLYCVFDGIFKISASCLRGTEKLRHYAICNILMSFCAAIFNIVFLVILGWGIRGYFLAYIIAYIVGSIFAIFGGRIYRAIDKFHIKFDLVKKMTSYSILLVPNSLMWWIMHSSDRVMVTAMIGLEANGIYAVSYKIPSIVSTLSQVFNQAWSYSAIHEDNSDDREEFNNKMFENLLYFQVLVTAVLLLIMRPFLHIYVSESFYEAWMYTPYLLLGNFFMTLGTFLSTSYTVHKDSRGFLFSGSAGAIINIVLNLLLIPILGISGAAIATCVSYIIVFIYRIVDTKRYIHIEVFKREYIKYYILIVLMAITMLFDTTVGNILLLLETILIVILLRKVIRSYFRMAIKYCSSFIKSRKGKD